VIPGESDSLALGVGRLHNDFARWQHMRQHLTGHFWQNRFFSCPLDDDHFWEALRYIELNPVRAGLVEHAWEWPWSSARPHVTGVDESGLLDMDVWNKRFHSNQWKGFLEEGLRGQNTNSDLRIATIWNDLNICT
jgi:putative transposase